MILDPQKLMDALSKAMGDTRSQYHLTLGKAIKQLSELPKDLPVKFDALPGGPGEAFSYRGYYSDLAFDLSRDPVTVGSFLDACQEALGETFDGYKGGHYTMTESTPLWLAEYGTTAASRAIMGIEVENGVAWLITREAE